MWSRSLVEACGLSGTEEERPLTDMVVGGRNFGVALGSWPAPTGVPLPLLIDFCPGEEHSRARRHWWGPSGGGAQDPTIISKAPHS